MRRVAPWIVKELPALMHGATFLGIVSTTVARLPWMRVVGRGLRIAGSASTPVAAVSDEWDVAQAFWQDAIGSSQD